MFTARDSKLWKLYCRKLLDLGITDIVADTTEEPIPVDLVWVGKYGTTPVVIEYKLWKRPARPGWVTVCTKTDHSTRLMFKLSGSARINQYSVWTSDDIVVECLLLR
jgi:hypothetical protein